MKESFNNIEDFLTDESFRSWVVNPTPELDHYWLSWLKDNQDKKALADQSRAMILSLNFREYRLDAESKQRILDQVKLESRPRVRAISRKKVWLSIAVVLLLVASTAIALILYFNVPNQQQEQHPIAGSSGTLQQRNAPGERTQHILPDGSIADLNSGSTLEYPETFGTEMRVVKLKGEAFFEVTHDKSRPFKVITESFEVVVLGTRFNVNTKPYSPLVALVDGKVRLHSNSSGANIELSPSQMAVFNKEQNSFTTTSFDPRYVTGWKDGYLVFKEASLDEVVEKLHSWYGINISLIDKPTSSDWSYTASFKQESLENVLLSMSILRQFDYQIKNDSLILSFQ